MGPRTLVGKNTITTVDKKKLHVESTNTISTTPISMHHVHSQEGGVGEGSNLQGKMSVYPVVVLSKGGVWGNFLKGGLGTCGEIGACARFFSGKYSVVP